MNNTAAHAISAAGLALALGTALTIASAPLTAHAADNEKCFGVAMKGKNDCAAGAHSCAGQATKDGDKASFIAVPAGLCARLAGGSTMAGK